MRPLYMFAFPHLCKYPYAFFFGSISKWAIGSMHHFHVAIDYANVKGCRITPNIYNSIDEIEIFIDAVKKLAS